MQVAVIADYSSGAYVAMVDGTGPVGLGCQGDGSYGANGKLSWPIITAKELSANDVWIITQLLKEALELP